MQKFSKIQRCRKLQKSGISWRSGHMQHAVQYLQSLMRYPSHPTRWCPSHAAQRHPSQAIEFGAKEIWNNTSSLSIARLHNWNILRWLLFALYQRPIAPTTWSQRPRNLRFNRSIRFVLHLSTCPFLFSISHSFCTKSLEITPNRRRQNRKHNSQKQIIRLEGPYFM